MEYSEQELIGMVKIIRNWTGHFEIVTKKDGYHYAIMGYSPTDVPVFVGPCVTEQALIRVGYSQLFDLMYKFVSE